MAGFELSTEAMAGVRNVMMVLVMGVSALYATTQTIKGTTSSGER